MYRLCTGQPLTITTGYVARQKSADTAATLSGETRGGDEDAYEMPEKNHSGDIESGTSSSRTQLFDPEDALAQGEVERRDMVNTPIEGQIGQSMSTVSGVTFQGAPEGEVTALAHTCSGGERERVEIVHEPPEGPTETVLRYRDANDRAHTVTLWDVPEGRFAGRAEGGRMREMDVDVVREPERSWSGGR